MGSLEEEANEDVRNEFWAEQTIEEEKRREEKKCTS